MQSKEDFVLQSFELHLISFTILVFVKKLIFSFTQKWMQAEQSDFSSDTDIFSSEYI